MAPLGLNGIKITLDGDRDTHNRMRPLRGGQGTFDRIVENVRRVAGRCRISIGGNFDESSVDSYPALLEFLKQQEFADKLAKVFFKPIVRAEPVSPKGVIPLIPVAAKDTLNGTCMTSVGSGAGSACDSCNVLDDKMTFLRQETRRLGFPTHDGVHNGPCHVHKQHAHTIGPDGSLYPCPGLHRSAGALNRPHRRPARRVAGRRAREIRQARSMEGVRRLRVHPGLCRRMRRGLPFSAWRHEPADVSQAQLRIGSRFAGAHRGQRCIGEVE